MDSYRSFNSIKDAIKAKKTNCLSLTKSYLQNIEELKTLNAFVEVFEEEAFARAKIIDNKIAKGKAGKLAGMVISIKDNICYKNHKVGAASKMLEGFESLYNEQ